MPQLKNIHETSCSSVTVELPKPRTRSNTYPFTFVEQPTAYEAPRPDPTYTFWKKANDTFPLGGIVYFIYCAGRIKIGYSDGLRTRLKQIAACSPFPPVALLVVSGTVKLERQLHARFAEDRLHGEWFALSPKMRRFFRSRLCPVGRASLKRSEVEFSEAVPPVSASRSHGRQP